jgi:hypothetical protein
MIFERHFVDRGSPPHFAKLTPESSANTLQTAAPLAIAPISSRFLPFPSANIWLNPFIFLNIVAKKLYMTYFQ